jgi:hypothetical protein
VWFLDCGPEDRSSPHSRKDGDHNPDIASQIGNVYRRGWTGFTSDHGYDQSEFKF